MEEPLLFEAGGVRLAGIYHPAAAVRPRAALVMVHALLEEKKSAHRILVETARTMAAAGIAVLRFDLGGCGDSDGVLEAQTLTGWRDQTVAAVRLLAGRTPETPLGLLGIRFGSMPALLAAGCLPSVRCLILWEPVTHGAAWLRDRIRQRLAREMLAAGRADQSAGSHSSDTRVLDVDGFRLTPDLVRAIEAVDPGRPTGVVYRGNALLVQIGPAAQPGAGIRALRDRLAEAAMAVEVRTVRAPPFWNRLEPRPCPEAAAVTLDWLDTVTGVAPPSDPIPAVGVVADVTAGMDEERPVVFSNKAGQGLSGILHPASGTPDRRRPAVLFLHGWGAYRIGPHRMFVHAARRFASLGLPVLRFDFAGRGDSEGDTTEASIDSMVSDAAAALAVLRREAPDRPAVLLGMCSGCKVAAALAPVGDVAGVVLWSPEPPDAAEQPSGGAAGAVRRRRDVLRAYVHKALDPAVWRKVFSGRVNWSLVRAAIMGRRGPRSGERDRDRSLYRAFGACRGRRLVVFGTADPSANAASEGHRRLAEAAGADYAEYGIEGADHNFYRADWETAVIERTAAWLAAMVGR